VKKPELFN